MKLRQIMAAVMMISLTQLIGCGGGGGGGGGGDGGGGGTVPTQSAMKGLWTGSEGTTSTSAIVLANGEAWVVFQESGVTTRFARLQTQTSGTSFSSTGTQYRLQTNTTETASSTGVFANKTSLTGIMTTASGNTNLVLAYDPRYETAATLNDAIGSWTGSFDNGSGTRTMNVAATGALTGSSTTGCTYNGALQIRPADPSLFDVNFTETCVVGGSSSFSGIATVNAAKTGISFAVTTADKTSGALFVGAK